MEKPWLSLYPDRELADTVEAPDETLYEMIAQSAERWPDQLAVAYMGKHFSYSHLLAEIDTCAAALLAQGVTKDDTVVISLPNIPNVVIAFYAVNKIGARAAMTHPLSSQVELAHYIRETGARFAIAVDMFYSPIAALLDTTPLEQIIVCHVWDYLPAHLKVGFKLTKGRKIPSIPKDARATATWTDFMDQGVVAPYQRVRTPDEGCVVLFSGGTTAMPKGIELSSADFNALAVSMQGALSILPGQSVLAILPAFHGFGLGLCIHFPLCYGAYFVLVPEFSTSVYIDSLLKYEPTYIAGVPTLFQALLNDPKFSEVSFAKMRGAFCGGDALTPDLKRRFDEVIHAQGGSIELVEGYGATECVTVCVLSPMGAYRHGSMGVPIPGCTVGVFNPETSQEVPYGDEGEICMYGPTMMLGYVNDPEATAFALRIHEDGKIWLHTGDVGTMDSDGYLYFKGRIKRILKVSGVSVYPMQVEMVLESHPKVARASVVGVHDDYQMTSVKAFIILQDGSLGDDDTRQELVDYCKERLIKWAVPRKIEFRTEFPMTRVGKIAYTELEKEEV